MSFRIGPSDGIRSIDTHTDSDDGELTVVGPPALRPDLFQVSKASTSNPVHLPTAGLHFHQHGKAVKQLQQALVNLGVLTKAEMNTGPGIFGPRTLRALKEFQHQHHLRMNGVFTGATRSEMADDLREGKTSQSAATARRRKKRNPYNADRGTPLYNQHSWRWRNRRLGRNFTIGNAGCAMTATAMAISRITHHKINPAQLDRYLDRHHGYIGDALNWDRAAHARGLHARRRQPWRLSVINKNLHAGKPVVVGVNYKPGSAGGPNGTDHWITITARKYDKRRHRVYYVAHDPGTGRRIHLYKFGNSLRSLRGARHHYNTTGQLVTFHK